MTWIVLALITILSLVTVSLVFGSSTYSSMPGAKVDNKVLGEDELLMPHYDKKAYAMIQGKHEEATRLVASADHSYRTQGDLQDVSQALLQAVKCYEEIKKQVDSAVIELNIAFLLKVRITIEEEKGTPPASIQEIKNHFKNVLARAAWFLNKELGRYEEDVKARYDKLNAAQDVRP